jgi:hypothetical protein
MGTGCDPYCLETCRTGPIASPSWPPDGTASLDRWPRVGRNCHPGAVPLLALGGSDCEALHEGLLGQPVNGLSSLAYVAAGAYVVRRGGPPGPALALALVGVGSVLYHGPMPPGAELVHDASLAAVPAVALAVAVRRRSFPRPPALALAALAAGAAVNMLGRTGAPLCRPDSLLQGHGLWHVLTAIGAAVWLARWHRRDTTPEPWPEPHLLPERGPRPGIAAPAVGTSMATNTATNARPEGAGAAEGERP